MMTRFQLGIIAEIPVPEIKGYEYLEFPTGMEAVPFDCEYNWNQHKAVFVQDGRPCLTSSHYLTTNGMVACGPGYDREQQLMYASRAFRRMHELDIQYVGVYGGFFRHHEGWSKTKLTDQAISFCNILADEADKYGVRIALEPIGLEDTLWPLYMDGLAFAKEVNRSSVLLMADLAYFIAAGQSLRDIAVAPEYCLNVHIAGEGGQPAIGNKEHYFVELFSILRDIGYDKGVTSACAWKSTNGSNPVDLSYETQKAFNYLSELRENAYR